MSEGGKSLFRKTFGSLEKPPPSRPKEEIRFKQTNTRIHKQTNIFSGEVSIFPTPSFPKKPHLQFPFNPFTILGRSDANNDT